MTTADGEGPKGASHRLHSDRIELEVAVRRIMDSITGAWECDGRPYVPEICSAAGTIIEATGRLAHALEKAARDINRRAADCYIDRYGEQTDATEEVKSIAVSLLAVAQDLRRVRETRGPVTRLGSIGERGGT